MLFRRLFVLRHHCCSSAATSRRHCMFQSSYSSGCRVAQLVKCLVTSGYPDGSSSGGPSLATLAREKTGKWKDSHPAVAQHDCPEINSSQRWCICKKTPIWQGATETWAAAGLLSLARRKTTSSGNGWLETMRRHV